LRKEHGEILPAARPHHSAVRACRRDHIATGRQNDQSLRNRSEEVARVLSLLQTVEPLLRKSAGHEIDSCAPSSGSWRSCSGSRTYACDPGYSRGAKPRNQKASQSSLTPEHGDGVRTRRWTSGGRRS
jgi:hypothetical protein